MTEANDQIPPIQYPKLKPMSIREPNEFTYRNFDEYKAFLFPEEAGGELPKFSYFNPEGKQASPKGIKETLRGIDEFFSPNAVILDIGSGSGRAVVEMNKQFASMGVRVIGLDREYEKERPLNDDPEMFKAGSWSNIPFADSTFTGLLGVESFPRYGTGNPENTIKTIKEITRVAKPDAVWRATFSPTFTDMETLTHTMTESGWEVFLFPDETLIVARLLQK